MGKKHCVNGTNFQNYNFFLKKPNELKIILKQNIHLGTYV